MKKEITVENRKVVYTLRKSPRARRLRLAVYCDGSIVVTTPFDVQETVAERFIREKSQWLFSKITFFQQFKGQPFARYSPADYVKYKDQAYQVAVKRVDYFNKIYKCNFNLINIKNQKTRWGSCSRQGNLNFNYKIVLLPEALADYIIVHELCHLQEFNHSKKFWNLVAITMPNYREMRNELKRSGLNFY